MKKTILTAGLACIGAIATLGFPASAGAASPKALAKAECKEERRTEPREFENRYGGLGKPALRSCVRWEVRDARRDCAQERREEPNEFRFDYGGLGTQAFGRCVRDEIR